MAGFRQPNIRIDAWSSTNSGTPKIPTSASQAYELPLHTASKPSQRSTSASTIDSSLTSVPEPGRIYMIREKTSGEILTHANGVPTVLLGAGTRGGWQWKCEEHPDGYLGFRDVVSGRYLGRGNKEVYVVEAKKLDARESFVLRPRDPEGYNLCAKDGHKLKPMGITARSGIETRLIDALNYKEAARWVFIKVESDI
ncbi:hypothetical protein NUW58_g3349 [Xylaria curta]|uniref:Uncharacterized protein n=1 Tax=Xylaria curta TaxID=42375 RepID=A0ACC1PBD0_9PEZI|nr:hypothetical protein NUW58_g3349 [Xylaria curta]